jgi:LPS export ABC transporter protein LptC
MRKAPNKISYFLYIIPLGISLYVMYMLAPSISYTADNSRAKIDYFAKSIVTTQFHPNGSIRQQLRSPHISHDAATDVYTIQQPDIIFYSADKRSWSLTSHYGKVLAGLTQIYLWDKVVLSQLNTNQQVLATIFTDHITYWPKQDLAQTDAKVTLVQSDTKITSTGMRAHMQQQLFELLSDTRGTYAPTT